NKALEKDPELRYQTAAEMRADLKRLKRGLESSSATAMASERKPAVTRPGRRWVAGTVLAVAAVACGLLIGKYMSGSRAGEGEARFTRLTFRRGRVPMARFAPDGQNILYSASWDAGPME